ncbi:MAG: hypothetical protein KR126chlam4_01474 [Candidatus Anoxychlamydiales bacterium]|nr:hypothetical protein [Candidatus Anoxychlamydiales bacterium]
MLKNLIIISVSPIAIIFRLFNFRFLDVCHKDAIGHLTIEPFFYLNEYKNTEFSKFKVILAISNKKIFNLFPKKISANKTILQYWKQYFIVISSPFLNILLTPIKKNPLVRINLRPYISDYWTNSKIFDIINRDNSPKYFFKLKKDQTKEKYLLSKLGIPKGAWYVCFACREPGYYTQSNINNTKCRCSDPKHLELAFHEIIKRGGWIIRLGSSKMEPLPKNLLKFKKVIDYPKTEFVSDPMDVFLSATCRFFIGSSSGLLGLPLVFNVPLLLVNTIPICHSSFNKQDLVIFKLYQSKKIKKNIPFPEIVKTPSANYTKDKEFENDGIKLLENSPEELRDATIEMLNRLEGIQKYSEYEEKLQNKMLSLFKPNNFCYKTPVRFASSFLKKYSHLLE